MSVAQDRFAQSLPDPDDPAAVIRAQRDDPATQARASTKLPDTGLPALALAAAGMSLLAGGVALRPAPPRRRTYNSDAWLRAVAEHRVAGSD